MAYKDGQKSGGRKKGTPNKTTAAARKFMASIMEEYADGEQIKEDWKKLKPRDRMELAKDILPYLVPKLRAVAVIEDEETNGRRRTIEDRLIALSGSIDGNEGKDEEEE